MSDSFFHMRTERVACDCQWPWLVLSAIQAISSFFPKQHHRLKGKTHGSWPPRTLVDAARSYSRSTTDHDGISDDVKLNSASIPRPSDGDETVMRRSLERRWIALGTNPNNTIRCDGVSDPRSRLGFDPLLGSPLPRRRCCSIQVSPRAMASGPFTIRIPGRNSPSPGERRQTPFDSHRHSLQSLDSSVPWL